MDPGVVGDPERKLNNIKQYLLGQKEDGMERYFRIYGYVPMDAIEMLTQDGHTLAGLRKKYPLIFQGLEKIPVYRQKINGLG